MCFMLLWGSNSFNSNGRYEDVFRLRSASVCGATFGLFSSDKRIYFRTFSCYFFTLLSFLLNLL
jgi:hypothetical protein